MLSEEQHQETVSDPLDNSSEIPVARLVSVPYYNSPIILENGGYLENGPNTNYCNQTQPVYYGSYAQTTLTNEDDNGRQNKLIGGLLFTLAFIFLVLNFTIKDIWGLATETKSPSTTLFPSPNILSPSPTITVRPNILSPSPTITVRQSDSFKDVTRYLEEKQYQNVYSISLSYDGTILAVLHDEGITIWKQDTHLSEWIQYGTTIGKHKLLTSNDTEHKWEEIFHPDKILGAFVTLSANGKRLMWDVHYRKNAKSSGLAVIYGVEKHDMEITWKRQSEILTVGDKRGGAEYGRSIPYARLVGDTIRVCNMRPIENYFGGYYVLQYDKTWSEKETFHITDSYLTDSLFGASCSISGDGTIVGITSPWSNGTDKRTGKLEVFERSRVGGFWKKRGGDLWGDSTNNNFGIVSMSNSGNEVVVGTPNEGRGRLGQVRMFRYSSVSQNWVETGKKQGSSSTENFGQVVFMSPEGNFVAAAASKSGRVCVYENVALKDWQLVGECIEVGEHEDYSIRISISLSANGERLVVGIPTSLEHGINAGIRIFDLERKS